MNIREFKNRIDFIMNFTTKMSEEFIPHNIQKVLIKIYANSLDINLTDKMINDIL